MDMYRGIHYVIDPFYPNPKGSGRRLRDLLVADRCFRHVRGGMLRITQCVSAEGAVKYFDVALCRSDYYTAEHGVWGGKAAERLGLRGEVTRLETSF